MNNQLELGFEEYPTMTTSILPDYNQLLLSKKQSTTNGFDPHKIMVQKKQIDSGEVISNIPKQSYLDKDIKTLEDFCMTHGIVGFNCGRMSPIAALAMLKQQLGIVDNKPLEERIPIGYERYGGSSNKKTLLNG